MSPDKGNPRMVIRLPQSMFRRPDGLDPDVQQLLREVARTVSECDEVHIYAPAGEERLRCPPEESVRKTLLAMGVAEDQIVLEPSGNSWAGSALFVRPAPRTTLVIEVDERMVA